MFLELTREIYLYEVTTLYVRCVSKYDYVIIYNFLHPLLNQGNFITFYANKALGSTCLTGGSGEELLSPKGIEPLSLEHPARILVAISAKFYY